MKYPRISVVIPSFNQGVFIEDTLQSVFAQGYPNLEIIVIDGGSSDHTPEILERHSDRFAYWHSRPDKGQADAINTGFGKATGDILCWLNSDDLWFPNILFRVAAMLNEHSMVYGATILFQDAPVVRAFASSVEPFSRERLTYCDYIQQPSTFWCASLMEQAGPLNVNYQFVFDWEWWLRAAKFCQPLPVNRVLSLYRIQPDQKSGMNSKSRKDEIAQIIQSCSNERWQRASDAYLKLEGDLIRLNSRIGSLPPFLQRRIRHLWIWSHRQNNVAPKDILEISRSYGTVGLG